MTAIPVTRMMLIGLARGVAIPPEVADGGAQPTTIRETPTSAPARQARHGAKDSDGEPRDNDDRDGAAAVDGDDGPDLPPVLRGDEQPPTQMGQRSDQDEDDHLGDNDLNVDIPF